MSSLSNRHEVIRSFRNLKDYPAGRPLDPDEVVEVHAARLMLLLYTCGKGGSIDGLTKLAKLDFFARYPAFFAQVCVHLNKPAPEIRFGVEAEVVRHHYGPWDHRYYHILAFLEGTELLEVRKLGGKTYRFRLTPSGIERAKRLSENSAFGPMYYHMRDVSKVFQNRTGEYLKNIIYTTFKHQVAEKPLGALING